MRYFPLIQTLHKNLFWFEGVNVLNEKKNFLLEKERSFYSKFLHNNEGVFVIVFSQTRGEFF